MASEVAQGKYALGFQQVSELLPVAGVTFIESCRKTCSTSPASGRVTAKAEHRREGKALLDFLASSGAADHSRDRHANRAGAAAGQAE